MRLHVQVGQTVACLGSGAFSEIVTAKAASCYPIREASAQACACVVSGPDSSSCLGGAPILPCDIELLELMHWGRLLGSAGSVVGQCDGLPPCHFICPTGAAVLEAVQHLGMDGTLSEITAILSSRAASTWLAGPSALVSRESCLQML